MTQLFLWDDEVARSFEPFALTRPVGELRAGTELIRARWERVSGALAIAFVGSPHLADFDESGAPHAAVDALPERAIVANSRCVPALDQLLDSASNVWKCDGRVAAVRLARALKPEELEGRADALPSLAGADTRAAAGDLRGRWLDAVWDLVRELPAQLAEDIDVVGPSLECGPIGAYTIVGEHAVYVEHGAKVEPFVVLDASAGPILVRSGATLNAFTRIVGPVLVNSGAIVAGGKIAASSVGEHCRVHGEVSNSIFLGYCNKAHDGFVGHSILGRWSNLGAGTTTSNLKNTYGSVKLWTPGGLASTGMQFLGTLFGDHAKTGIGMRLTTGTVLGAGANVYGSSMPAKVVSPFAWGDGEPYSTYDLPRFLQSAERMMARRQVTLSDPGRRLLTAAHAARWSAAP